MSGKKQKPVAKIVKSEFSGSSALSNRTLNPSEVIQSRSNEITSLVQAMDSTKSFRQVFQTLPKHLRRRAASHNPKRIPKFLRAKAIALNDYSDVKTRKKKRKSRGSMPETFGQREGKVWLPTHVWHAKRMHMKDLWGFRLAMHSNQKGFRLNYRAMKESAIIHEMSYLRPFELVGSLENLKSFLQTCLDPMELEEFMDSFSSDSNLMKESTLSLYENVPFGFIGPLRIMKLRGEPRIWIWLHPSTLDQFNQKIAPRLETYEISIESLAGLSRFSLVGKRAIDFALNLELIDPPSHESGHVVCLEAKDPRLGPVKVMKKGKTFTNVANHDSNVNVSKLWNKEQRDSINPPRDHELNEEKRKMPDLKPVLPVTQNTIVPLILICHGSIPDGDGDVDGDVDGDDIKKCDIIVSSKQSFSIWKALVFSGAKSVGILELKTIEFEQGLASFPFDFPDSVAFDNWIDCHVAPELESKYEKLPPAKKPKFHNIKEFGLDPFVPRLKRLLPSSVSDSSSISVMRGSWLQSFLEQLANFMHDDVDVDDNSDADVVEWAKNRLGEILKAEDVGGRIIEESFVAIRLKSVGRGNLDQNALLYSHQEGEPVSCPEPVPYPDISSLQNDEETIDKLLQQYEASKGENAKSPSMPIPDPLQDDRLIGLTTVGGYSLANGTNCAIGFIRLKSLMNRSINLDHVWYRLPHWKDRVRLAHIEFL